MHIWGWLLTIFCDGAGFHETKSIGALKSRDPAEREFGKIFGGGVVIGDMGCLKDEIKTCEASNESGLIDSTRTIKMAVQGFRTGHHDKCTPYSHPDDLDRRRSFRLVP